MSAILEGMTSIGMGLDGISPFCLMRQPYPRSLLEAKWPTDLLVGERPEGIRLRGDST